jgi:hypothetical protein
MKMKKTLKISKIGQYAKMLVVVLTMAFLAGACSDKEKDNELVGTNWQGADNQGMGILIKFTSNTQFTVTISVHGVPVANGQGTYTYTPPAIVVNIPITPELEDFIEEPVQVGVISGNTMTFGSGSNSMVFTKVS